LRNPQLNNYYDLNRDNVGVSNFLSDNSLQMKDLVINQDRYFENYDMILAGPIPPNPSELLLSERFKELIKKAKDQYDYVIVDTAPTILVADTLLISKYADITLYIVRSGYTDNKLIPHIKDLYRNKNLHKMGVVINKTVNRAGYGFSYG